MSKREETVLIGAVDNGDGTMTTMVGTAEGIKTKAEMRKFMKDSGIVDINLHLFRTVSGGPLRLEKETQLKFV